MADDADIIQTEDLIAASPKFDIDSQIAFRVHGNSMDLAGIPDGSIILCVDVHRLSDLESGDIVVVERREGHLVERTCKQLVATGGRAELWPRSSDPKHKAPIIIPDSCENETDDGLEVAVIGLVVTIMLDIARPLRFRKK